MSPETMTLPKTRSRVRMPAAPKPDATPREIIEAARAQPAPMRAAFIATSLTALLSWASFTPLNFSPLGWICLVPFLLLARIQQPTRRMYVAAYLGGLLFWLPSLQWMRLGHVTMYTAWMALSFYLAAYFPIALALTRTAVQRFRIPLALAFPVVWVGLELARGHLFTGFGWYYLGHTQYRWLELIQVSDLVGAYGVSFLVAMMSACAALMIPQNWLAKFHLLPPSATEASPQPAASMTARGLILSLVVFAAALGYGFARRSQADFDKHPGPLVAAVQSNVDTEVKHDPQQWIEIHRSLRRLTELAVREQPDLIIWPESMFRFPLFESSPDVSTAELEKSIAPQQLDWLRSLGVLSQLSKLSKMANAAMVVGIDRIQADEQGLRTYNSAAFVSPDAGYSGRYDKIHRVPFGEYLPLTDTLPWLAGFTPYPADFGIAPGEQPQAFEHQGIRYAPVICFEDTVPHVVRQAALTPGGQGITGKPVDVLLNLTNDGWFHGSSELDQHLITAAFRCVENRTPMVRAVNTGISAIIDGDGAIRTQAIDKKTGRSKQVEAVVVDTVPLDNRESLYLAGGDWFSGTCLGCCGFLFVAGLFSRWIPKRTDGRHNMVS